MIFVGVQPVDIKNSENITTGLFEIKHQFNLMIFQHKNGMSKLILTLLFREHDDLAVSPYFGVKRLD